MNKNKYFILAFLLLFSCCNNSSKILEEKQIEVTLTNRDHVIALQNNSICYAIFKNIMKFDIYIFDENEILLKQVTCTYVKKSDIKKITETMNKSMVISIIGNPAIIDDNRFIYFQRYFDFSFQGIEYGIDRRIFEIIFSDDVVIQINEKYVSRY